MALPGKGITHRPMVTGRRGMVASAPPLASLAGLRILMQGGNAVDAAVATAAALNVTEAYMSGIGGVGYMIIYSARKQEMKVLDYIGLTPRAAQLKLFDTPAKHSMGALTPLVPGACGGWLEALSRYGRLKPIDVFAPAIEYAEQGYPFTVKNHEFYRSSVPLLTPFPASVVTYLPDGRAPLPGEVLVQKDLAATFRKVAEKGPEVFYRGEIADAIVRCCERNGGLITKADLEGFRTQWLDPISTTYRGYEVFCPPPPCEGIQYLETLNILEGHDLAALGHNSAESLHLFIEAGKLAQVDRAEYSAIPNPPTKALLSKNYAAQRRRLIGERAMVTGGERYTPLSKKLPGEVLPGDVAALLKECTTHFDAVDAEGNAVAVTQSLGGGFGSGMVVDGTGIALNNFINWFDREPESPNAIGPSKKIEMCLSPAQIWKDGKLFCVIGTPGSYGIMFTTPQMMMNLIDHGMNVQAAIEAPRVKATSPGRLVDIEARIPEDVRQALQARGHELHVIPDWSALVGGGQGIMVDQATGALGGGADPRRDGYAMGW